MRQRNRHGKARPPEVLFTAYTPPGGEPVVRVTTHRQADRLLEALRGQGCEVHGLWDPQYVRQGLVKYGINLRTCALLDGDLLRLG